MEPLVIVLIFPVFQNFDRLLVRTWGRRPNRLVFRCTVHPFDFAVGLRVIAAGADLLDFKRLHKADELKTDKLRAVVVDQLWLYMRIFSLHFLDKSFDRRA